jgi:phosphorylcholine metabolism protein LicD
MEPLLFPEDRRLSPETNAKKVHSVILRMLKIFDVICSQYDIDYWLDYGTLLGAVRHRGFIPWDMEADVGMLRSDFDTFLERGVKHLPNDIFFQTKETDEAYLGPSPYIEAKLRDKYSNYTTFAKGNPHCKWHNGIQIDIFIYDFDNVLDNCLTNSFERNLSNRKIYLKREELEYVEKRPFQDYEFPVPAGFDAYLRRNYDNYWECPPLDRQVPEGVDVISPCDHSEILIWESKEAI